MDRSIGRCLVFESEPYWAHRLRAGHDSIANEIVEVRIASMLARLLDDQPARLVALAIHDNLTAEQSSRRLRMVSSLRRKWPECRPVVLLDPDSQHWLLLSCELAGGPVFVGMSGVSLVRRMIRNYVRRVPTRPATEDDDPLAWLPW